MTVWFDIFVGFQDFEYWIRGLTGTAGTRPGLQSTRSKSSVAGWFAKAGATQRGHDEY